MKTFGLLNENENITTCIDGHIYNQSDFCCDNASDIDIANEDGSAMLNYPNGTSILCYENGKVYQINTNRTAYVEVK